MWGRWRVGCPLGSEGTPRCPLRGRAHRDFPRRVCGWGGVGGRGWPGGEAGWLSCGRRECKHAPQDLAAPRRLEAVSTYWVRGSAAGGRRLRGRQGGGVPRRSARLVAAHGASSAGAEVAAGGWGEQSLPAMPGRARPDWAVSGPAFVSLLLAGSSRRALKATSLASCEPFLGLGWCGWAGGRVQVRC